MVNIDCMRDCIARYEMIAQGLSEEVIRLKNVAGCCEKTDSVRQKAIILASQLADQTEKINSVAEHLIKYCNDSQSAEQKIVTEIKRKLFLNDARSLLGKVIIESEIKKTRGWAINNHTLIHDEWLDDIIIKNIAGDLDI